jgi:hypothetical protein
MSSMVAGLLGLLGGLELLESNVHQDAPPIRELVLLGPWGMPIIPIFPMDPRPPWGTLIELQTLVNHYIHKTWHVLPSPSPQSLVNLGNGPLGLNPLDTRVI